MNDFAYLFESETIDTSKKVQGKIFADKAEKKAMILFDRFKELNVLFPEKINKNETLHLISSDNFGSIELLKVILKRYKPKEINLTTWSYNEDFLNVIEDCLKENVLINFFVDKSIKTRKTHLYAQLVTLMDIYPILNIRVHHMLHSKITLFDCGNDKIVVESSANYSKNQRIENFTISNSEQLFNFHKKWMFELIGK